MQTLFFKGRENKPLAITVTRRRELNAHWSGRDDGRGGGVERGFQIENVRMSALSRSISGLVTFIRIRLNEWLHKFIVIF